MLYGEKSIIFVSVQEQQQKWKKLIPTHNLNQDPSGEPQ